MQLDAPLAAAGAAGCLLLAGGGVALLRADPAERLGLLPPPPPRVKGRQARPGPLTSAIDGLGARLLPLVLPLVGSGQLARDRRKLDAAGRPGGLTPERLLARKVGSVVLFGGVGLLLALAGSPLSGLLLLAFGLLFPEILLAGQLRRRQDEIERALPDFLDVLAVTVGAGLGFRQALGRVGATVGGPLGEEVATVLRQMDLGVSRRVAFERLRERNRSPSLVQFVTALLQAEELGSPLAAALVDLGQDMRRTTAQSARRRAARAAPRISLVITLVMVPAIMIVLGVGIYLSSGADFNQLLG